MCVIVNILFAFFSRFGFQNFIGVQNSVGMDPSICFSSMMIGIELDDRFADDHRQTLELVFRVEHHLNRFFSMQLY